MTRLQITLYGFIRRYQAEHGVAPTYRQMAMFMGSNSTSGIHRIVQSLIAIGKLRHQYGRKQHFDFPDDDMRKLLADIVADARQHGAVAWQDAPIRRAARYLARHKA